METYQNLTLTSMQGRFKICLKTNCFNKMKKKDLDIWIRNLSNEEKKIMQLRFGLNGEEPLTLKEISLKLGIKVSKANLLEIKSIQKLRELCLIK